MLMPFSRQRERCLQTCVDVSITIFCGESFKGRMVVVQSGGKGETRLVAKLEFGGSTFSKDLIRVCSTTCQHCKAFRKYFT
jgi:hypothetical protein